MKISAFQNNDGELVTVILNRGNSEELLKLHFHGSSKTGKIFETSEQNDLKLIDEFKISDEIKVAPESVSTIIM